jgi:hypothetical protein
VGGGQMMAEHPVRAITQTSCPRPVIKGGVWHNRRRLFLGT